MSQFFSFLTSLFLFFTPTLAPTGAPGGGGPINFYPYPASNITVNWNSPGPAFTIFMDNDVKPCDVKESVITVTNNGSFPRPLTVRGIKTAEEKNFSQILDISIFKDDVLIYGPKKLNQFFTESATLAGVSLGTLAAHTTSTYKFVVEFPCSAGNEYQLAKIVFDLKIGKIIFIPCPCTCTCYQHTGGQYPIHSCGSPAFATFSEGDHVTCGNPPSCASPQSP